MSSVQNSYAESQGQDREAIAQLSDSTSAPSSNTSWNDQDDRDATSTQTAFVASSAPSFHSHLPLEDADLKKELELLQPLFPPTETAVDEELHSSEPEQRRPPDVEESPVTVTSAPSASFANSSATTPAASEDSWSLPPTFTHGDILRPVSLPVLRTNSSLTPKLPPSRKPGATCTAWDGLAVSTFDNVTYSADSNCSYLLTQNCKSIHSPMFTIYIHLSCPSWANLTCGALCERGRCMLLHIFFSSAQHPFLFITSTSIYYGSRRISLPFHEPGVASVRSVGDDVIMTSSHLGLEVHFSDSVGVAVWVSRDHAGTTCGLCGLFDGQMVRDLEPCDGESYRDTGSFLDSCRYDHEAALPHHSSRRREECRASPVCHHPLPENSVCKVLVSEVFRPCHGVVDFLMHLDQCRACSCVSDAMSVEECQCFELAQYSRLCAQNGVHVDWRTATRCRKFLFSILSSSYWKD